MRILVTGTAGFIGSRVAQVLLARGDEVIGFDNLNDYYDPTLKQARLNRLLDRSGYTHITADLADRPAVEAAFAEHKPQRVVHLAAQAGVRYAAENPHIYVSSNVTGFVHILEGCRHHGVEHLVYASTSSVYGANRKMPFSEHQSTEHPLTLYAATKKANEQMAHSYAHLYGIPCTGLRFFTVYGPWGRPDMALFKFAKAILAGEAIEVFGEGKMSRDFTYVDDLVEAITRLADVVPGTAPPVEGDTLSPVAPFRLVNIGGGKPSPLMDYIGELEGALGRTAIKTFLPMQDGDVPNTTASPDLLERLIGYKPQTPISVGVPAFVGWFRQRYDL